MARRTESPVGPSQTANEDSTPASAPSAVTTAPAVVTSLTIWTKRRATVGRIRRWSAEFGAEGGDLALHLTGYLGRGTEAVEFRAQCTEQGLRICRSGEVSVSAVMDGPEGALGIAGPCSSGVSR